MSSDVNLVASLNTLTELAGRRGFTPPDNVVNLSPRKPQSPSREWLRANGYLPPPPAPLDALSEN
jgi:hypothetical protein